MFGSKADCFAPHHSSNLVILLLKLLADDGGFLTSNPGAGCVFTLREVEGVDCRLADWIACG